MPVEQRCETPELKKTAVEAVQTQNRRAGTEHSHREGIRCAEAGKFEPLHLFSKVACQWIQQLRTALIQKGLQERRGLG